MLWQQHYLSEVEEIAVQQTPSTRQLITMLDLQHQMNRKVHSDWQQQGFAWYRAAWIECGELMDHVGYKWWKKQETDWQQVQLEIVDIWHFGLSDILARTGSPEKAAAFIGEELSAWSGQQLTLHEAAEAMALSSLESKQFVIGTFVDLMTAANLDFESLYTAYVGKNVLNFFRQDNGYKEGTYQKLWDGREDNEHLSEIVQELDSSSDKFGDELYRALDARYGELTTTA